MDEEEKGNENNSNTHWEVHWEPGTVTTDNFIRPIKKQLNSTICHEMATSEQNI